MPKKMKSATTKDTKPTKPAKAAKAKAYSDTPRKSAKREKLTKDTII